MARRNSPQEPVSAKVRRAYGSTARGARRRRGLRPGPVEIFWPMKISRYAEELLARRPPPLTSSQAAKLERRYQRPVDGRPQQVRQPRVRSVFPAPRDVNGRNAWERTRHDARCPLQRRPQSAFEARARGIIARNHRQEVRLRQ